MPNRQSQPAGWSADQLNLAIEAAGVALWAWNVKTDKLKLDSRGCDLWGVPSDATVTFEDLSAHIHPSDRDRVRAAFAATRAIVGPYEIDFRIMLGTSVRWISARGKGDDDAIVRGNMFGVFLDVTGRKQAEEGHELLAGEMSHRVKNLLSIASGLTTMTARSAASTKDMARELTERLTALGRAHDLVRPLPRSDGRAALLGDLFTVLLAPYDDQGAFSGRVRVAVPRMGVGENAATSLALAIHELATNSVKYGALSVGEGLLDVSCTAGDADVTVVWTERGGPAVAPATLGPGGFGSKLIERSMRGLGGSIDYEWSSEGLIASLRMRPDSLTG
ncbi:MAG: histidine kinase [Hyphomicrobiales bacterium]|nr:histidine kinase [Hyphomicrobiales bacterium]